MPAGGFKKGGGRTRTEKRTALEQGGELAGRQENGISVDPTPPHPGELNTPPKVTTFQRSQSANTASVATSPWVGTSQHGLSGTECKAWAWNATTRVSRSPLAGRAASPKDSLTSVRLVNAITVVSENRSQQAEEVAKYAHGQTAKTLQKNCTSPQREKANGGGISASWITCQTDARWHHTFMPGFQ